MSHPIRTFRAATADEALAQVRREMGTDAVVVEVSEVKKQGLFGWLSSKSQFEVKASRPANTRRMGETTEKNSRQLAPSNMGTIAAAAMAKSTVVETHDEPASIARMPQPRVDRNATLAELPPPPNLLPELEAPRYRQAPPEHPGSTPFPGHSDWSSLAAQVANSMAESPATIRTASAAMSVPGNASIEQRLDALQQMIADLGRRSQPRGLVDIPPDLFPHYMTLIEAGVEDDVARELIQQVERHAAPGQLGDTGAAMALLTALVEQRIPCKHALSPVRGRRQIAMVVGPTGVGKTTTLAKLAGRFGVEPDCRVGLITVDTYRIAAVEQLRTYADIINLPMQIVSSPNQVQDALDALADCDLVLIDTAGRSPHDERRLSELKQLIDAAQPDHVYLVLSLASGTTALRDAADRFATVRPTSVVYTKLDEATGCGGLLSAMRDVGLPVSYFTTGQEVPRDIEPAHATRAARLIMGLEPLHRHHAP